MQSEDPSKLLQKYPYHLVEFINIGRKRKIKNVDVVATKWLEYNTIKKKCTVKYPPPPYTDATWTLYNGMLAALSDEMEDWLSYPVVIKGRAKSLSEANSKCEQLKEKECALTLESEGDDYCKAEKRAANEIRQAQLQDLSASITDQICNTHNTNFTNSASHSHQLKKIRLTEIQQSKSPIMINKKKSEKSECGDDYKEIIINKLTTIMVEIQQLKHDTLFIKNEIQQIKSVQQMAASIQGADFCTSVEQLKEKYIYDIPFRTVTDFQKFDSDLKDNDSLNKDLKAVLEASVDPTLLISKCIVNMLKKFLSKEVAMQYVAIKKKINKYTMKNTNFFKRIDGIIKGRRESMGLTTCDKVMITALSNVLSNSISWYKTARSDSQNEKPEEKSIPDANGKGITYEEPGTSFIPKIVATGTIKDGVLTLDNSISTLTSIKECAASSDTDSDVSDYEDYERQFTKEF